MRDEKKHYSDTSAGQYTGICSHSRYVSNTSYHGYHSIITIVIILVFSLLHFCELEVVQEAIS